MNRAMQVTAKALNTVSWAEDVSAEQAGRALKWVLSMTKDHNQEFYEALVKLYELEDFV